MDIFIHIVPVIAAFNKQGNIKPLYVKIEGEQLKIIESYSAQHAGMGVYHLFNCIIDDHGIQKAIQLNYNHSNNVWTITT